ncbi:MAG: hypothetical protein IJY59_06935 [Bacteroidaceae bacterium]|nr:hypothetical protein [Bacteroidaceae bacterium]
MKRTLFFIVLGLALVMVGCKANYPVAQQSGKDDVAFLLFVSASNQSSQIVDVTIDGNTTFEAKTVKAKKANRKGTSYAVATGRRRLKVEKEGQTLYEKEVFLSTQETKIITLP